MKAGYMFASSGHVLCFLPPIRHMTLRMEYNVWIDEIAASALDQWRRSNKVNMYQLLLQVTGFKTLESLGGTLLALNVVESI